MIEPDLSDLERSAFLDEHGRFAKSDEAVTTVRLFFSDRTVELTAAEYGSLSAEDQETIRNSGSGAGLVDTDGKSNA